MVEVERTLVIVKPDGVERSLVGEIISRFEKAGLKIVGMKMIWLDREFTTKHYSDLLERKGKQIFERTMEQLTMGPVVAIVLEGTSAVDFVRKMAGPTQPSAAAPGTIRGDFAHANYAVADGANTGIRNIMHASGSVPEAKAEVALWFSEKELFNYETVHDFHILHKARKK